MLGDTLLIFLLWIVSNYLFFLTGNLWPGFSIDIFWLIPFAIVAISKHRLSLLLCIAFGLTYDNWVLLYPGINGLSSLLISMAYLRVQKRIHLENSITRLFVIICSYSCYKLLSFIIIYLMGQISLFWILFSWQFWINYTVNITIGYFVLKMLSTLNIKYNFLLWDR